MCPWNPEEDIVFPGAIVRGGCVPPLCPEKQTVVLCKSSWRSLVSHFSHSGKLCFLVFICYMASRRYKSLIKLGLFQ